MSLHAAWLFIPWSPSWDWSDFSPFHDHKRASRVLIGQLVMTWSSLLPIGQRSLFNTTPSFPDSSFQSGWTTTKISSGRTLLRPTTIWPNGSNEVWPAGFTFQQCRDHHLIDFALALGLTPAEILVIVGPDTGYVFPKECPPTST